MALALFLPEIAAVVLGWWLASRHLGGPRSSLSLVARGLLILFAVNYVVGAQFDIYMWQTYFPTTPFVHEVGPHWPTQLFVKALIGLKLSGALFLLSFLVTLGVRSNRAKTDKPANVEGGGST